MRTPLPRLRPIEALVLVAACLAMVAHALRYDFVSDDAFVAARYARNLIEGHGLVYEPGERVEGFTSPLWVAVLAVLGALGFDLVGAMRGMSLAGALGCVLLAHSVARRMLAEPMRGLAALAPCLVAAMAPLACWALGGLEQTGVALAVLAAVSLAAPADASRAALLREGLASALCVALRPEGICVVLGLSLARLPSGGPRAVRASLVALAPSLVVAVGLTAWRLAYYGAWLSNSAYAKLDPGAAALSRGAVYLAHFLADHGSAVAWVFALALAWLPGLAFLARAGSAVACSLLSAVVWVGGDGLPMYRFFVPVLPLFAVLVAAVCARAVEIGLALDAKRSRVAWLACVAAVLGALALALASPPRTLAQYRLYREQHDVEIPRWREVGRWLERNTPRDALVACVPIGAIGYYSRRRIVDMAGLTDPQIARRPASPGQSGHQKHDGPYVLSRRPTLLLLGNVQVLQAPLALDDPAFGRPRARAIRLREDDVFTPELRALYEPRVARLPSGGYLHYFGRR